MSCAAKHLPGRFPQFLCYLFYADVEKCTDTYTHSIYIYIYISTCGLTLLVRCVSLVGNGRGLGTHALHTHTHTHTRAHTHTCVHTRVGPWYQRQCGASEHAVIMQSTSNARLFWTLYFAYGTLELGLWVVMSPFVGSSVLAFCWHFVPLAISPWRTRTC